MKERPNPTANVDTDRKAFAPIDIAVYASLALLTFIAYLPVLHAGFVNYDDPYYVVNNPNVHTVFTRQAIAYAFSTVRVATWQPLIFLSFMLDWMLYGLKPMGYHLTNLLLHVASTLLFFHAFRRMTGCVWRSAVIAALFALHPLHVESVAWISERKDTLSTLFWVLTMFAYAAYSERRNWSRYLILLITFALGLMSKSMLVTLPVVLLMVDYWPLNRLSNAVKDSRSRRRATPTHSSNGMLIIEKIPLLVMSVAIAVVTACSQQSTAMSSLETIPMGIRIENALVSCAVYIGKMFWPVNLAIFYPHPMHSLPAWQVAGSILFLAGISYAVFKLRAGRPYLLTGWLWFLITLTPVVGIVQVGLQAMADRYTYIPLIGLFVMLAWGIPELPAANAVERKSAVGLRSAAGLILLLSLCFLTWRQCGYWHDSVSLYEHTLSVTRNNFVAEGNIGFALGADGRLAEAARHFQTATSINPQDAHSHYGLAIAYAKQSMYTKAIAEFAAADQWATDDDRAGWQNFEQLVHKGLTVDNVKEYALILTFAPNPAKTHTHIAADLANNKELPEAIDECRKALRIDSDYAPAHYLLGQIMQSRKDYPYARAEYLLALKGNHPVQSEAYARLAGLDSAGRNYQSALTEAKLCQRYGGKVPDNFIPWLEAQLNQHKSRP